MGHVLTPAITPGTPGLDDEIIPTAIVIKNIPFNVKRETLLDIIVRTFHFFAKYALMTRVYRLLCPFLRLTRSTIILTSRASSAVSLLQTSASQ